MQAGSQYDAGACVATRASTKCQVFNSRQYASSSVIIVNQGIQRTVCDLTSLMTSGSLSWGRLSTSITPSLPPTHSSGTHTTLSGCLVCSILGLSLLWEWDIQQWCDHKSETGAQNIAKCLSAFRWPVFRLSVYKLFFALLFLLLRHRVIKKRWSLSSQKLVFCLTMIMFTAGPLPVVNWTQRTSPGFHLD